MKKISLIVVSGIILTGCSGMSTTEQRTLSGGAIGAAAGAGIVAIAGANPIWGGIRWCCRRFCRRLFVR